MRAAWRISLTRQRPATTESRRVRCTSSHTYSLCALRFRMPLFCFLCFYVNATLTTLSWCNFHFRQRKSNLRFSQQDQELFRAQMDTEAQTHNDTIAELSGKAGKAGYRNLPVTCDRADYFRFLVQ